MHGASCDGLTSTLLTEACFHSCACLIPQKRSTVACTMFIVVYFLKLGAMPAKLLIVQEVLLSKHVVSVDAFKRCCCLGADLQR